MNLLPVGRDAVLVEVGSSHDAVALAAWARDRHLARDAVPGATTVLLDGLADGSALPALADRLAAWTPSAAEVGPEVEVPVTYDGPDLGEVASLTGLSHEEVIARHTGAEHVAAFLGFQPGFAYLTGGDDALHVPRREVPRTQVPGGAVAIAGPYSGVYPRDSPGGWRLLGSTATVMFDPARDPPALLAPGDRVRFVPA